MSHVDYDTAVESCISFGLSPLTIKTSSKHLEFTAVLNNTALDFPVFIGLTEDPVLKGKWLWYDGTVLSPVLRKWAPGQGNSKTHGCAVISAVDYLFYETYCDHPTRFVCETDPNA